MNNFYEYGYTLINAICLPNFNILCVFYDEDTELIFVKQGNFKFFVETQIKIGAPGAQLNNPKEWIKGKFEPFSISWDNGVSLGDDYLFEHTKQIF